MTARRAAKSGLRIAMCILAILPAVVPLWFILRFGVNVPYWDQWLLAPTFTTAGKGELLANLWRQHNEHRIFFPKLVFYLLAIHGWDIRREMIFEWLIVCATSLGILKLIEKAIKPRQLGYVLFLWFACNMLIFCPQPLENWLEGIGIENVMPMAWITAALLVATSDLRIWPRTIFSILLAAAATYSSGNGILAWPLVGWVLAWSASWHELWEKRNAIFAWIAAAGICVAVYFLDYTKPVYAVDIHGHGSLFLAKFVIGFVGNFASESFPNAASTTTMLIGGILLAIYLATAAYVVRAARRGDADLGRRAVPWLAIGAFSILSAILGGYFRGGYGLDAFYYARYISFGLYLPVSLLPLISITSQHLHQSRQKTPLHTFIPSHLPASLFAAAIIIIVCQGYPLTLQLARSFQIDRAQGKTALMLVNVIDDTRHLEKLWIDPAYVKSTAEELNHAGYFHPPLVPGPDAAAIQDPDAGAAIGAITELNTTNPQNIWLRGTATLPREDRPADAVFLTYQDSQSRPIIFAIAQTALTRNSPTDRFGPDPHDSLWTASFSPKDLPDTLRRTVITAWVLNLKTGKTTPLGGASDIQF